VNKQQILAQREKHYQTCPNSRHEGCMPDEPNWLTWVVVAAIVAAFGGSAIGFLVWVINGQKPF
jgi:hypothetical protein